MTASPDRSLFNVNLFTPRAGQADAFRQVQLDRLPRFAAMPGLLTSRLFAEEGGDRFLLLSGLESIEAHRAFMATPEFGAHRERLLPLIEQSDSRYWRLIYARGTSD
ncbi:MAG: antibiotic biosynthesis monooxygenase family protein [Sphingomonas sp.]